MKKQLSFVVLCILLVSLIAAGCNSDAGNAPVDTVVVNTQTPAQVEPESTQTPDVRPEDIVTKTPYGSLYYPGEWADYVQIDQESGDGSVEVTYSAKINGNIITLFSIVVGESDGSAAGMMTAEDGTQRNVYVKFEELTENEALNETEQQRLYAMQEDLNYLIDNLK